jgi:hypothetical protein
MNKHLHEPTPLVNFLYRLYDTALCLFYYAYSVIIKRRAESSGAQDALEECFPAHHCKILPQSEITDND